MEKEREWEALGIPVGGVGGQEAGVGAGRKLKAMSREDEVKKGKGRTDFCL